MAGTATVINDQVRALEGSGGGKTLHRVLWGLQILLALAFGMAGFMKTTTPLAELATKMHWVSAVPPWLVRFIGGAELAGAAGLVLPAATRILPWLTPLAASGLVVVMALAIPVHLHEHEAARALVPLTLGLLAAIVAWGRFGPAALARRD